MIQTTNQNRGYFDPMVAEDFFFKFTETEYGFFLDY